MPFRARPSVQAPAPRSSLWLGQLTLVACVVLACLAGIFSRPVGYLAAFWPANAVLLGLMLRRPHWARSWSSWPLALAAYVATDMAMGAPWTKALGLNLANIAGVALGWWCLARQSEDVVRLRVSRSVLYLFSACLLAGTTSALLGSAVTRQSFDHRFVLAFSRWLATELSSYMLILPMVLAAPDGWLWRWRPDWRQHGWQGALPLLALAVLQSFAAWYGGPGALGFSMPALVWCAMTYGVFATAVLNFLAGSWMTALISMGAFGNTSEHTPLVVSLRLGIAMLSLAPLAVACTYATRQRALAQLNHWVNHDFLTGTLSRRALLERGAKMLESMRNHACPLALLMVDLDHFKIINDRHGHAQGDLVLQQLVQQARQLLRPEDILGRLGGEEFAVLLPNTTLEHAHRIAERLCGQLSTHPVTLSDGTQLTVTCSIGVHGSNPPAEGETLSHWLSCADQALYRAKASGRNQVQAYRAGMAPLPAAL